MTRYGRLFTSAALAFVIALFPGGGAGADTTADKSAQLNRLRDRIQSLRSSLKSAQRQRNAIESRLRSSELQIARHSQALKKLSRQLHIQRSKLHQLQLDRQRQQRNLDTHRQALARQIRASYTMGKQGALKILLSQQNPSAIGRTLTYYDYFNRARADRITAISEDIDRLDNVKQMIARETRRLAQLADEQQSKKRQREKHYRQRQQILIRLNTDIGSKERQLQQLLQDKQRLSKLLEELHKALSDIPPDVGHLQPFAAVKGKLSLPANGHITHRFGSSRKLGKLKWQGLMIEADAGKEVRAIYHGRVAFADWIRNFGLLLIIDHGDGYMSLYGHNQALYKDVGEWVKQGELVATIGNSGGQGSSGLYFEIRHNGIPTNPGRWIKQTRRN